MNRVLAAATFWLVFCGATTTNRPAPASTLDPPAMEEKAPEAPPAKTEEAPVEKAENKAADSPAKEEQVAEAEPAPEKPAGKPEEKPAEAEETTKTAEETKAAEEAPKAAEGKKDGGEQKSLLEILNLRKKEAAEEASEKAPDAEKKEAAEAKQEEAEEKAQVIQQIMEKASDGAAVKIEIATDGQSATVTEAAGEEEEAQGEETKDAEAPKIEAPPPEPLPPMFYMRDGTRLAGFPRVEKLHVETAYGPLVIPVEEVQRLRFATGQQQEFEEDLIQLIERLGAEEFDLRETAMEEIRKIGPTAVPALKQYLDSEDEEIKSRVEKLVEELEEEEEEPEEEEIPYTALKGDEDEIVTLQFTAKGVIQEEEYRVKTRYGDLVFHRDDIIGIVFQEPLVTKKTFQVSGQHQAGDNKWLDTEVELEKDEPFTLSASGTITITNYGNSACGPEGTSNVPNRFESFPGGALVAKVGDGGKPFLVGSEYEGKASEKGKVFLGIAMRDVNINGSFEVELETEQKNDQSQQAQQQKK